MHGICYWTNNTLDGEPQDRVTQILSPFSAKGLCTIQVPKLGYGCIKLYIDIYDY